MKSFLQYISESELYPFIKDLTKRILLDLQTSSKKREYSLIREYEFLEPNMFDLKVYARWDDSPNFDSDTHFNELNWERHNFSRTGYSINAITKFNDDEFRIPEIDIFIIINGSNPTVYDLLYSRLAGIITHELRHVRQIGLNKEPFMGAVSTTNQRANAQQSYKYFLLPEEMDAMIEDKYIQAIKENRPVDDIICEYLYPFVKDEFMTSLDFKKVFTAWIKRAIELFPDAIFSRKAEKIVNKI